MHKHFSYDFLPNLKFGFGGCVGGLGARVLFQSSQGRVALVAFLR